MTLWLGLVFVVFSAWHTARFTFLEFVHGARDWGLLGTPQWMPQIPMTVGLTLFAAAILGDICRLRPPAGALARWTLPLVAVALARRRWPQEQHR